MITYNNKYTFNQEIEKVFEYFLKKEYLKGLYKFDQKYKIKVKSDHLKDSFEKDEVAILEMETSRFIYVYQMKIKEIIPQELIKIYAEVLKSMTKNITCQMKKVNILINI